MMDAPNYGKTIDSLKMIEEMCRHIRYNVNAKEEGGFKDSSLPDILEESVAGFVSELDGYDTQAIDNGLLLLVNSSLFYTKSQNTCEEEKPEQVSEPEPEDSEVEEQEPTLEEEEEDSDQGSNYNTSPYLDFDYYPQPLTQDEDIVKRYWEGLIVDKTDPFLKTQDNHAKRVSYELWRGGVAGNTKNGRQFMSLCFEEALNLDFANYHSNNRSLWDSENKKLERLIEMTLICHFAYDTLESFRVKDMSKKVKDSYIYRDVKCILSMLPNQELRFSNTTLRGTLKELYYNTSLIDTLTVPLSSRSNHDFIFNASVLEVRPTFLKNTKLTFSDWLLLNVLTSWIPNEEKESHYILMAALVGSFQLDDSNFWDGLIEWLGITENELDSKLIDIIQRSIPFGVFIRQTPDDFVVNPKIRELREALIEDS